MSINRVKELKTHCEDCCCAASWAALGIDIYDGKSIVDHINELKNNYLSYVESSARFSRDADHYRALYYQALNELKK